MSNRTIFTSVVRASFPHLAAPHAQNPTDQPKYAISMMWPKTGICPINNQPSSFQNVLDALNEVCLEEFKVDFATATAPGMGIQFPPTFKDGDLVFQKDANKQPIHGQIAPETAGMQILSAKNVDPVGTVDPTGTVDINPASIYGGAWVRCQLEISAYTGKNGRVVVAKLLNVQMCYDDTNFGGRAPQQAATAAFAGQGIADTNVAAGFGQGGAMPAAPALAAPAANADPVVMNAGEASYAEYVQLGWSADQLIAHGKAKPNYLVPQ